MALKAIATVDGYHILGNGNLTFDLVINKVDGSEDAEQQTDEISPTLSGALINTEIKNFVKTWTAANWGISWTPVVDTVLLLNGISG